MPDESREPYQTYYWITSSARSKSERGIVIPVLERQHSDLTGFFEPVVPGKMAPCRRAHEDSPFDLESQPQPVQRRRQPVGLGQRLEVCMTFPFSALAGQRAEAYAMNGSGASQG